MKATFGGTDRLSIGMLSAARRHEILVAARDFIKKTKAEYDEHLEDRTEYETYNRRAEVRLSLIGG